MDYQDDLVEGMDERELRMHIASLRQTMISKKENLRREQTKLEKEELDINYLSRQKEEINGQIEDKESKMKIVDNDIYSLTTQLEEKKRTRTSMETEIVRLKRQSSDMDYQIKSRNKALEEKRYEIRELEQEAKRLEIEIKSL